ncbi:hypothetical protein M378DRAFT_167618 [Amanita muscaria Koide BX008]|uniref:Uncharacterized protein n=1 Tax=Amanita muscaria (strain Koide BX008) TaxID=946122 RepID=A0A0C2T364_AMAMK|nr:hypothetical protein M378DRAFT_167618 [Amanita muscaria Koide BX008]
MDQARCKDPCLRIDPKIGHTQIATCCFKITNKHLKYNILGLGDAARYMSNEEGLKKDGITDEQLQEKIPQHLRYASVYWANHFEVADIEDTGLMNGLEKFVDEHTLHWFEVLSLIGNLDSAHRAIRAVMKLLKSTSSDLHRLLSDALRFISKFYGMINRSALHTYHSALPFSPTDSLLYRRYIKEARHNIFGIEGGPKKWDALVAILSHGEGVDAIKFSLESALLVSFSESEEYVNNGMSNPGKLKIWDAAMGTPISTITGHTFAFTDDFSTVASSLDNIITYYNVNGSAGGMLTTPSTIHKLALSESSRVAAVLSDGTVWLWDSRNAELICSFDGFKTIGWSWLEFSRTGSRLAYSSAIGVTLRDGISGRFIADLPCEKTHKLFSDDGSRIVSLSLSYYGGLALWNTESGGLVDAVRDVDAQHHLAISANGSLLATADEYKVTLWSENRDHLAKIEVLEIQDTWSMAFSVDNLLAIGTEDSGIKLYNTNTHSFISTLSFTGFPVALAFSPDGAHVACGNTDGNMHLWDMQGIDASSPLSKKPTRITAMALSRDCSQLACAFADGTVELWETSPTKCRTASRWCDRVSAVGFGPDGRLFASGSDDGTIKLWNVGDVSLYGTLIASGGLEAVALSGGVLVAAGKDGVTLWSLDTLSLIHTLKASRLPSGSLMSSTISDDSDLAAIAFDKGVHLVDVMNGTTAIATFTVSYGIRKLTFLPDKTQLVAQIYNGDFQSFNLINNSIANGPTLEHLIQLPDTPLWHGVPVWLCWASGEHYVAALFPQHQTPVPVLWIPSDISVMAWAQGSSMIALGCDDGRIILLRLRTSHLG